MLLFSFCSNLTLILHCHSSLRALWNRKVGDSMQVKGPYVKLAYEPNKWSSVGMVAGGTGITPMYQLILEMLANPRDKTEIRLIYASRTEADIILKTELDALATVYPNFKVRCDKIAAR